MKKLMIMLFSISSIGISNLIFAHNPQAASATMEDNANVQVLPDGTKVIKKSNGAAIEIKPDGTKSITRPDGTSIQIKADGSKVIKKADGTTVQVPANASQNDD